MIVRARVVMTMDGPPIDDGAVAVNGEWIIAVGKFAEVQKRHGGVVVDLGEHVLMPGLINAHCHLDYTCLRGAIPRQSSFTDWIKAINAKKSSLTHDRYIASIEAGFREARRFGTTTIVNLIGFPDLIGSVPDLIRTWWCAEVIDVRSPGGTPQLFATAHAQIKTRAHAGFAPHAPYTASAELYRCADRAASAEGLLCTTHVAESFDEFQMFRHASGDLYDFLAALGRDMSDCGMETPFARAVKLCGGKADWLFVHLNELADDDFTRIEDGAPLHVAHCPRSHRYFGHSRFAFERLRDVGANVCLGTDSLASSPDLSLFAEMREFRRLRPHVSASETLEMVTVNAARAIGQFDALGRLRERYFADLIAIPLEGATANAPEIVIEFADEVPWMIVGGEVVLDSR